MQITIDKKSGLYLGILAILVVALAKTIRDGQSAEIVQMKNWLQAAGASESMGHDMGDHMGGVLSDAELAALKSASGEKFDQLWLSGMTGHHEGALHMTTMIQDATNPAIKEFGQNILTVQTAQINQMAAMIKRLS